MDAIDRLGIELWMRYGGKNIAFHEIVALLKSHDIGASDYIVTKIYSRIMKQTGFFNIYWVVDINKIEGIINGQEDKTS